MFIKFKFKNNIFFQQINIETNNIDGHVRVIWGLENDQKLNNIFNITLNNKQIDLKYALFTPQFPSEETLLLLAKYDSKDEIYTLLNTDVHFPGSKRVGAAKVSFQSLININGTLNVSTSFPNLAEIGIDFIVLTNL